MKYVSFLCAVVLSISCSTPGVPRSYLSASDSRLNAAKKELLVPSFDPARLVRIVEIGDGYLTKELTALSIESRFSREQVDTEADKVRYAFQVRDSKNLGTEITMKQPEPPNLSTMLRSMDVNGNKIITDKEKENYFRRSAYGKN